jgi:adenosylhomocysteinase
MNSIWNFISKFYSPEDYAALDAQRERWKNSRPFAGAKILDGTPIFRNTLVKYAVLLDAGAELTISAGKNIPCDSEIIKLASEFGIRVANETILKEKFDAVADCAGRHIAVNSRCGYAELTRSGLEYYKNSTFPVYSVDSGILKRFETTLGTGESFVRAMKHLGYNDFSGKKIIVFGGGKVGRGTAWYSALAGAEVFIADINKIPPLPNVKFVDANDMTAVEEIIKSSWCVVSATGAANALSKYVFALKAADTLIANMGVEDEFGPDIPASRVLNNKEPLNFILPEPTLLRYIDPAMALSNAGAAALLSGSLHPGLNIPDLALEDKILADVRHNGIINAEITRWEAMNTYE